MNYINYMQNSGKFTYRPEKYTVPSDNFSVKQFDIKPTLKNEVAPEILQQAKTLGIDTINKTAIQLQLEIAEKTNGKQTFVGSKESKSDKLRRYETTTNPSEKAALKKEFEQLTEYLQRKQAQDKARTNAVMAPIAITAGLAAANLIPGVGTAVDASFAAHGGYGLVNQAKKGTLGWNGETALNVLEVFPLGVKGVSSGARKINDIRNTGQLFGNYYWKPQYNDLSYIRLVGDDAIEDMLKNKALRSSGLIEDETELINERYADFLGYDPIGYSKSLNNNVIDITKTFSDLMFNTGRPFYGPVKKNYIITNPRPITKSSQLTKNGLEWIESGHKGHTRHAKNAALKQGKNPDTAPGRIVVPLYNGQKDFIPLSEFGPFDLYQPIKVFNKRFPIFKKTSFNSSSTNISPVANKVMYDKTIDNSNLLTNGSVVKNMNSGAAFGTMFGQTVGLSLNTDNSDENKNNMWAGMAIGGILGSLGGYGRWKLPFLAAKNRKLIPLSDFVHSPKQFVAARRAGEYPLTKSEMRQYLMNELKKVDESINFLQQYHINRFKNNFSKYKQVPDVKSVLSQPVKFVNRLSDGDIGEYNPVLNTVTVSRFLKANTRLPIIDPLTKQIGNQGIVTHELEHAMQHRLLIDPLTIYDPTVGYYVTNPRSILYNDIESIMQQLRTNKKWSGSIGEWDAEYKNLMHIKNLPPYLEMTPLQWDYTIKTMNKRFKSDQAKKVLGILSNYGYKTGGKIQKQ